MAQRPRLIVGNWKMHKTIAEARDFAQRLGELLHDQAKVGSEGASAGRPPVIIVIAAPFTTLSAVASELATRKPGAPPVELAAQNVHWEDHGAFTGEVSAPMLNDAGCRYVLIGHSERRQLFGETDAMVNQKVTAALRHGLRPILCVGETWEQRSGGETKPVLTGQVTNALAGIAKDRADDVVIAYEPVWAIGSGHPAKADEASDAHRHIRATATTLWGQDAGERLPILYGGSVTPDNIGAILAIHEVDGALIGGACLDPAKFARIVAVTQPHS